MNMFQLVVAHMEKDVNLVLAHFNEVTIRDALILHFRVHCAHVGAIIVPGQAAPVPDYEHKHIPKELVYAFSRKQMLATKPGSDSAIGWA